MNMPDFDIGFFGVKVPPGQAVNVVAEFDDDHYETIHLTQAALGENAKAGPHTVFIQTEGKERFAVGTLDRERCSQFSLDITLATDAVAVSHTGKTDVYLTGYRTVQPLDESDDEDYAQRYLGSDEDISEEDMEDGSEEESEEEEEAPQGVPLKQRKASARVIDDEAEEGSESEEEESEEEESEEEDAGMRALAIQGAGGKKGKGAAQQAAAAAAAWGGEEDSSEQEEESEEEEDEEEDSESEEEEPAPAPAPAKKAAGKGEKRPQPQQPAKTPQPAKKARAADGTAQQKVPATAPPKVRDTAGPANQSEYIAALKEYLKSNGPQKLASLGSKVKRPDSLPKHLKLKALLQQNAAVFKHDTNTDTVSLA